MFKNYKELKFPDLVTYNGEICVFVDIVQDEEVSNVLLARENNYYCPVLEDNTEFDTVDTFDPPGYIHRVIEREAARRWWASPEGREAQRRRGSYTS